MVLAAGGGDHQHRTLAGHVTAGQQVAEERAQHGGAHVFLAHAQGTVFPVLTDALQQRHQHPFEQVRHAEGHQRAGKGLFQGEVVGLSRGGEATFQVSAGGPVQVDRADRGDGCSIRCTGVRTISADELAQGVVVQAGHVADAPTVAGGLLEQLQAFDIRLGVEAAAGGGARRYHRFIAAFPHADQVRAQPGTARHHLDGMARLAVSCVLGLAQRIPPDSLMLPYEDAI